MAYFPMFVELEGRPCLIVGGGAVALRKALRCAAGHFAPGTWRDRRWWSPRRATAR